MAPLPITILLPTRNSMSLLPEHLRRLQPLLPMAEAVLHVDSESRDGAVECVRDNVQHPHFQFFSQPPGLYQSWNFGIGKVATKYVYVSTVGETMDPSGLPRLLDVAENFSADAVVSIPRFVTEQGEPAHLDWPIHKMIRQLALSEPALLPRLLSFIMAVQYIPNSILNSSASNLYRAQALKERPFPTDFGTAGDSAWPLLHSLESRIAILPECFSTFLIHEKTYSLSSYRVENICSKMYRLAIDALSRGGQSENLPQILKDNFQSVEIYHRAQEQLETYRGRAWPPWILFPAAWKSRSIRNRSRKQMRATADEIVAKRNELGLAPQSLKRAPAPANIA